MKTCTYCGFPAQCRDHVIPVSMTRTYRTYNPRELVPACNQCNELAGDFPATSVKHKAKWILKKYELLLRRNKTPEWSEEELLELNYKLRCFVMANIEAKRILKEKIAYMHLMYGEVLAL